MLRPERYEKILALLDEKGAMTIGELCDNLEVSKATIRRDLSDLSRENMLCRAHGGAMALNKPTAAEVPIQMRKHMQKGEKVRIAREAIRLIKDGDLIYIGAGTTTRELAMLLDEFTHLTILTNDIDVASEISKSETNELIVAGGVLKRNTATLTGVFTERVLDELHVDIAFMSVDAVDPDVGCMDYNMDESVIKRIMIKNSRKCVLLCDHSKFMNTAFISVCPVSDIDIMITSEGLDSQIHQKLFDAGTDLRIVPEEAQLED